MCLVSWRFSLRLLRFGVTNHNQGFNAKPQRQNGILRETRSRWPWWCKSRGQSSFRGVVKMKSNQSGRGNRDETQSRQNIRRAGCSALFGLAGLLLFFLVAQASAQTSPFGPEMFGSNGSGDFKFRIFDGANFNGQYLEADGKNSANSNTVQHWKGTFKWQGQEFAFTLVGTDPSHGSATTTIPVVLVPVRYVFADGSVFDPSMDVSGGVTPIQNILNSPLFQDRDFVGGVNVGYTQLADAMQRANFWNYVSSIAPDYHIRLDTPTVLPTQTVVVPAGAGNTSSFGGETFGIVDGDNFLLQQTNPQLLQQINADPRALVILLSHNIFFTSGGGCCDLGLHFMTLNNQGSSINNQGNSINNTVTYIWSSYFAPGSPLTKETDIALLSHEVAEWINDPFTSNLVPPWSFPHRPYAGQFKLEVEDPLVIGPVFDLPLNGQTYHVQDMAFLPWFTRTAPSTSVNGQYSFFNQLSGYSEPYSDFSDYSFTQIDVPGATSTRSEGINRYGQIVGNFNDATVARHGFLLDNGVFTTFDAPGAISTIAIHINDAGQIVGYYIDASQISHGFVLTGGLFTVIDVPGSTATFAGGINNHGDVAGAYIDILGVERSFTWNNGQFNYISPSFAVNSEFHAINDHGDLVGVYNGNGSSVFRGFLGTAGSFATYNFPNQPVTSPWSVTNHDVIAGFFHDDITSHAFVNGGSNFVRIDVAGASFTFGFDIDDDQGRIVGYFGRGGIHGFLATPNSSNFKK